MNRREPDYSNPPGPNNAATDAVAAEELDLRGVRCPMNWVKTKLRLEELERGSILIVWLDDAQGVRHLPQAAEAAGYVLLGAEFCPELQAWRIVIEK